MYLFLFIIIIKELITQGTVVWYVILHLSVRGVVYAGVMYEGPTGK